MTVRHGDSAMTSSPLSHSFRFWRSGVLGSQLSFALLVPHVSAVS